MTGYGLWIMGNGLWNTGYEGMSTTKNTYIHSSISGFQYTFSNTPLRAMLMLIRQHKSMVVDVRRASLGKKVSPYRSATRDGSLFRLRVSTHLAHLISSPPLRL
jgi:hypothetical protein